MATLIFSAIGRAVGGRVGAAVGAIAGQLVDQSLFGPPPRQGARLGDLSVQTSTYGAAIPKLFGRTRVAGSVIWSTDLIETTRRQSNGKGRAASETYSYSASFAVLLSARRIVRVERIWADGKLLRGAGGDLKTELAALRIHNGDADQSVDPLIASAEGADAPAYRGSAYAVFEGLQLADYGNRIPSLTFEVVADEAAVPVGRVIGALGAIDADDGPAVAGCVASGDSLRALVESIAPVVPMRLRDDELPHIVFAPVAAASPPAADLGATPDTASKPRMARESASIETTPSVLAIGYADPARDYQPGVQRAIRSGPGARDTRIDLPFALDAADAAQLAAQALARAGIERSRATISLPWRAMMLRPGDRIAVSDVGWRIAEMRFERMAVQLDLVRHAEVPGPLGDASPGRPVAQADEAAGPTTLALVDLPPPTDIAVERPRVAVFAAGASPGWRQASLMASVDGGATYDAAGITAAPAVIGTTLSVLSPGPVALVDRANTVRVHMVNPAMTLFDADEAALLSGANRAMIGDEFIQFGRAEPEGGGVWQLSALWRGRRGTEDCVTSHPIGSRFVLVEADTAEVLPDAFARAGVTVMASGVGDSAPYPQASLALAGRASLPLSPAHLAAVDIAAGNTEITWVRRSRAGWGWPDGVDAPLCEEREAYRVTRIAGANVRVDDAGEPRWVYTAVERAADIATGATALRIDVAQIGTFGASPPASIAISLI